MTIKIISGGQTGVDRGALDAALKLGIECGGWCPEGRLAEDGVIPDHYPVKELPGGGCPARTRQNVKDSDATLIIYWGELSGGTEKTLEYCLEEGKPYKLVDAMLASEDEGAGAVTGFIGSNDISILNIAGPRASGESQAHDYTQYLVECLLKATLQS